MHQWRSQSQSDKQQEAWILHWTAQPKSRSRDAVSKRLGFVSVSRKSGKISVSVSSRTENRRSRSQRLVLQARFQRQKFTEVSTDKQAKCRLLRTACRSRSLCFSHHRLVKFMYYQPFPLLTYQFDAADDHAITWIWPKRHGVKVIVTIEWTQLWSLQLATKFVSISSWSPCQQPANTEPQMTATVQHLNCLASCLTRHCRGRC